MTLSSSEAEYVIITECVQETMFVKNLLESIGIKAVVPAPLYVGNVGAIFIARNASTKGRTEHTTVRYHFVCKLMEDRIITINFVRGEDNTADPKNTSRASFNRHLRRFVCEETEDELKVKEDLMKDLDG